MFRLLRKERRKVYRVQPPSTPDLLAFLVLPGGEVRSNKITDLNVQGANIAFPAAQCPNLARGHQAKLKFLFKSTQKTYLVDTVVRGANADLKTRQLRFQFVDSADFLLDLDPSVKRYFNQRQAYRVAPDPEGPAEVRLEWREGLAKGRMLDISTKGMGIGVARDVALELGHPDRVMLTFELQGSEKPLAVVGQSFFRKSDNPERVRYGIKFVWSQTDDAERKEKAIAEYIARRQQALASE
jgi:hypothetical protein